jgi:hypothetical protein
LAPPDIFEDLEAGPDDRAAVHPIIGGKANRASGRMSVNDIP